MSDAVLDVRRDGSILRLTLQRPEVGNAINLAMGRALMEASILCDEDPDVRCVVLTGAGKLFCAGGDVGDFAARGEAVPSLLKELTAYLHMAITRFAHMNKPLVTVINGPAAGAGLSLAVLGDIALAAQSAHFTLAYTALGLSPDGGSTWLLPRLIGLRRTQELCLTNRRVDAAEAAAMGLITRAVADDLLETEATEVATRMTRAATRALGRTRNLLLSSYAATLETQMEAEARAIADAGRDSESREGISAFAQRRKPDFLG